MADSALNSFYFYASVIIIYTLFFYPNTDFFYFNLFFSHFFLFLETQLTKGDQTVTRIIAPINLSHKREKKTQNLSTESLLKSTGDLSNKTFPIKKHSFQ